MGVAVKWNFQVFKFLSAILSCIESFRVDNEWRNAYCLLGPTLRNFQMCIWYKCSKFIHLLYFSCTFTIGITSITLRRVRAVCLSSSAMAGSGRKYMARFSPKKGGMNIGHKFCGHHHSSVDFLLISLKFSQNLTFIYITGRLYVLLKML